MKENKLWKLYFLSPECGGIFEKAYVYARTLLEAKRMVANKYYISERLVFQYE